MRYAQGTYVTSARSRQEIESMLERRGASRIFSATEDTKAIIGFVLEDRLVRFDLKLPSLQEKRFWETPSGKPREGAGAEDQARRAWEQECRELWRALTLSIKAKLVSVESGVESFEQAFLAHVVTSDGKTTVHQLLMKEYGTDKFHQKRLGAGS